MKKIFFIIISLLWVIPAVAQTTLSPMAPGFVGNAGLASAAPGPMTPQQAAGMIVPFLGGGGATDPTGTYPWPSVKSGAFGCPAAAGDGATDDSVAIQCYADHLTAAYGGGSLFVPPASYLIKTTLVLVGVVLVGAGPSKIVASGDLTAIDLKAGVWPGGFRDLFVQCDENGAATQNCVEVETNSSVFLRDSYVIGGKWALHTAGVDGYYENVFFDGFGSSGGAVWSQGANWYVRDKLDTGAQPVNVAFYQSTFAMGAGIAENHLVECDFSGNYQYSLYVDDSNQNSAVTFVAQSVLSSPIGIAANNMTVLSGDEIGSSSLTVANGNFVANGNVAFHGTNVSGGAARTCSGNVQLGC